MAGKIITTLGRCGMEFYEDFLYVTLPDPSDYRAAYFPFLLCNIHSSPVNVAHVKKRLVVRYEHD